MLAATRTEFTRTVRRNLEPEGSGPKVRDVTKELHRTFPVTVFQFAVRRTHAAERLNPTLDAFRNTGSLAVPQLQQRFFPDLPYSRIANSERLLLRDYTDPHLSIGIDSKGIHATTTGVNSVTVRQIGWIL